MGRHQAIALIADLQRDLLKVVVMILNASFGR